MLQLATLERTRDAIRGLAALAPAAATVLRDGVQVLVPATEVAGGDLLLVRPGERLAVDGVDLVDILGQGGKGEADHQQHLPQHVGVDRDNGDAAE